MCPTDSSPTSIFFLETLFSNTNFDNCILYAKNTKKLYDINKLYYEITNNNRIIVETYINLLICSSFYILLYYVGNRW